MLKREYTILKTMRTLIHSGIILFVVMIFSVALAQEKVETPKKQTPPPPASNVKMIWDYKPEIGLTDTQVDQMKGAITDFEKEIVRLRAQLQTVEGDLQSLIQKKADMELIKLKLRESADLQVQLRLSDIETARKIDAILTNGQLAKWREIQKREGSRKTETISPRPETQKITPSSSKESTTPKDSTVPKEPTPKQ